MAIDIFETSIGRSIVGETESKRRAKAMALIAKKNTLHLDKGKAISQAVHDRDSAVDALKRTKASVVLHEGYVNRRNYALNSVGLPYERELAAIDRELLACAPPYYHTFIEQVAEEESRLRTNRQLIEERTEAAVYGRDQYGSPLYRRSTEDNIHRIAARLRCLGEIRKMAEELALSSVDFETELTKLWASLPSIELDPK